MSQPRVAKQVSGIVGGRKDEKFRFTVITDGLIRYEWAPDGDFEDRPSAFAVNRHQYSVPEYRLAETDSSIAIYTERFHLTYDKRKFSPEGLFVCVYGSLGTTWRYGEVYETLGGTYRTLDGVDGRVGLEPGVTSRKGFANIDDDSMLLTEDGFIAPRKPGPDRVDSYLFATDTTTAARSRPFTTSSGRSLCFLAGHSATGGRDTMNTRQKHTWSSWILLKKNGFRFPSPSLTWIGTGSRILASPRQRPLGGRGTRGIQTCSPSHGSSWLSFTNGD